MLRYLTALFTGLALILFGADLEASGGQFLLRDVGHYWFAIDRDSLQLAQPAIERHVWPPLWDPVMITVLTWPAALVSLGFGLVLLGLGRVGRGRAHPR